MGNPNENIQVAVDYYDKSSTDRDRDARIGGCLAALLLLGCVVAVIAAVVALALAVS